MPRTTRREFLWTAAAAVAPDVAAPARIRTWLAPQRTGLPSRPWRKVHLDFHNSQHVKKIGARFDPDEFGETLREAAVNAVVVFAKDMHGYFYYPSRFGPVHPGLDFDLLARQVAACRKRNIAVYAYYCTTWDNYLAERHPEWLVFKRDRTTYLPAFDATPGWTALCLSHESFVELMIEHAREFVSKYEIDGAWFDMPVPIAGECFCPECLHQLRSAGQDPFDTAAQRRHKHALHRRFIERMSAAVRSVRTGCQVDYNGQGVYGLGERVASMDNIDIEALPTAFWGYWYFPTLVRYTRTFGVTTYGMTGRFKASWADFGGLKLPAQLDTELAAIVAHGARCDVGDQMPPQGRLDPAVYHVLGSSYRKIAAMEAYLENAAPVTEAALLTSGMPLESPGTEENYGLVKLLTETRVQFDILETGADFERYGLVILPDTLAVDTTLAARLLSFVAKGGSLIASGMSGVLAGTGKSWLEPLGWRYHGPSPFKPAYLVLKEKLTGDIPNYEYALYDGAIQWSAEAPSRVVAVLGEPAFQRGAEHYTSHAQSPFDHETPYAALSVSGQAGLIGFPLGLSYYNQGYWVYRTTFQRVLQGVLPERLIETDAPLSTELTVTHQDPVAGRPERYIVHIVNFSAARRTPKHPDFYEDPIPLTEVRVRLNVPVKFRAARAVLAGIDLPVRRAGAGWEVFVRRVPIHEMIAFE